MYAVYCITQSLAFAFLSYQMSQALFTLDQK